jgi:hypothetical protein
MKEKTAAAIIHGAARGKVIFRAIVRRPGAHAGRGALQPFVDAAQGRDQDQHRDRRGQHGVPEGDGERAAQHRGGLEEQEQAQRSDDLRNEQRSEDQA